MGGPLIWWREIVAEASEAGPDPALDGAFGPVEDVGDFAVGVAVQVGELDGLAFADWQGGERLPHLLGHAEVEHFAFEVVPGVGGAPQVALLAPAPGCFGPQHVD